MFELIALGSQRVSGLMVASLIFTGLLRLLPLLRQFRFERMLPLVAVVLDLRVTGGQTLTLLAGGFGCLLAIWGHRSQLTLSALRRRAGQRRMLRPAPQAWSGTTTQMIRRPAPQVRNGDTEILILPAPRGHGRVVKISK